MAIPEKLYTALGRVTHAWGLIDLALDFCNLNLYHKHGGKAIEPNFPRTALNKKIAFFRDCLNSIPALAPAKGIWDRASRQSIPDGG
jgi:hypothetical protein